MRSDDTDFHYKPLARFTLRQRISIGKSRRIRRRYRRALRRRRYLVNNRRLAVLQSVPAHNCRANAISALWAARAVGDGCVHRRSVARSRKNTVINKIVSIELQNYVSAAAVCSTS